MRYPDFIKIGDTIGITAPSAGITKKEDWLRLDNVKNNETLIKNSEEILQKIRELGWNDELDGE